MQSKLEMVLGTKLSEGTEKALNSISGLFKKVSVDAANLAKKLVDLKIITIAKPLNEGAKASKGFAKGMDTAAKSTENLGKKGNATISSIKRLNEVTKNLTKIAPAVAGISVPPIPKVSPEVQKALNGIFDTSKKAKKGLNELGDEGKKTVTILDRLKSSIASVGAKLRSFAAYAVGAAIFATLVGSIYSAQQAIFDYDQALHDLKAITQATDEETARMGETIKEVAATTKFSTVEVANGMRTLGQAGFTAEEAIRGIKGISDLATGTLTDMADAVDLVSTAIRAFGMDASEATEVSDVFANAINGSKLTMDKLRVAFNYVGPIAKLANVQFKDLTSTMMMLANKGIRASTIGTGLRQVLNKILKPTEAFTEAVASAGLTMDDLNPKTNSMRDVIGRLSLVVTDADEAFKMFGMRGAAAVSALVEGGTAQFDEMRVLVDRTGIAAKMADEQLKGLTLRLKQLMDKFSVFFAELRDKGLGEPFGWVIDAGRLAMDVMINFAKNGLVPVVKWLGILVIAIASANFIAWSKSVKGATFWTLQYTKAVNRLSVAFATLTKSIKTAWVATKAFVLGLGPLGWLLTVSVASLALLVHSFRSYSKGLIETIKQSERVISAMDRLDSAIAKTKVNLIGIREGTDEYKEGLQKLKDELETTAEEFPEIKKQADLVIASMDILNGTFTDGKKALENFETTLSNIRFEAASDRILAFDKSLESSLFWRFITGKVKDIGKNMIKGIWDDTLGWYFTTADKAVAAFSDKYETLIDLIADKTLGMDATSFEEMEKASKDGGKALEDWNNLLAVGKEYVQDWSKETGIAIGRLSPEAIENLSYEMQSALDVSDRMRKSLVAGAEEIAEAFKKQGIGHQINQWDQEFMRFGDSVIDLKYKLTQQGGFFGPFGKALESTMDEVDWDRLFDLEAQKAGLSIDLMELEKLYADHVIDHEEYARQKYAIGKRFNEAERKLKTDEKFQLLHQFADLAKARNAELEKLKIYADKYSKEQQEMMRLEIDDKYLTKSTDLLYKLDAKRKKAADDYAETENEVKEKIADSWEDYYADMKAMAKDLSDERAELSEKSAEKILASNISLNHKLRDLKSDSLKKEVSASIASKDIYNDLAQARKAVARGEKDTAIAYAKEAQKSLSSLTNTAQARTYAGKIAEIYRKSGRDVKEYQIELQNDIRDVRDKEILAVRLDMKARREMERDLSNARKVLAKEDFAAALKYAKSAEASLGDVKDIKVVTAYVKEIRRIMKVSEEEMLAEKQRALTSEYQGKEKARKAELNESLQDNQVLMDAAKTKYTAEAKFLDDTLLLQKRNTAESLKGLKAQVDMYNAAKRTAIEVAKDSGTVVVQAKAKGGPMFPRLTDPYITKGSGVRDDVPAMLKKKEFVFRPEAVEAFGVPFLRNMNDRLSMMRNVVVKGFSGGGLASASAGSLSGTESFVNVNLNLPVPGKPVQTKMSSMNATELIRQLKVMEKLGS